METPRLACVVLVFPQVPKVHREFSMGIHWYLAIAHGAANGAGTVLRAKSA